MLPKQWPCNIRTKLLTKAIFDPLYRSDALAHKEIGGTGLGFSIVANACALLAIELDVASEVGQGTTFTLHFPADGPAIR